MKEKPRPVPEHPVGSVQSLSAAALSLLTVLVAFVGYASFNGRASHLPWSVSDLVQLVFSLIAAVCLLAVPWYATQPQTRVNAYAVMERSRRLFLCGALSVLITILIYVVRDYLQHHV